MHRLLSTLDWWNNLPLTTNERNDPSKLGYFLITLVVFLIYIAVTLIVNTQDKPMPWKKAFAWPVMLFGFCLAFLISIPVWLYKLVVGFIKFLGSCCMYFWETFITCFRWMTNGNS